MRRALTLLLAAALPLLDARGEEPAGAPPIATAGPASPAPAPAPDLPYLAELQALARQKDLAESTAWLRLGHWRPRLGGGWKSEADGPAFFRAKEGKTDPAAELQASLAGLFVPGPGSDELDDAQCRFPARFAYLVGALGVDLARLPLRTCPKQGEFLGRMMARGVTLVFSSWYLNNPASAFGHTFLRLDKAGEALGGKPFELLDTGVDYSAQVDTGNPFVYAVKGLFGAFKGRFSNYGYYYKVREYADYESRDLWELDLAFEPGEVAMLAAHLWELGGTWFDYWYLDENCSYHVLGALEAAAPRLDLLSQVGRAAVLPSDTIKAVFRSPGLVRRVHYRPSIRTQFEARVAHLDGAERAAVDALAADAATPLPASMPPAAQAAVLDAAADLIDARLGKAILLGTDLAASRRRQALLERRSEILVASPPLDLQVPEAMRPDRGHGSSRVEVGGGASRRDGPLLALDFRLTLHDLLDPPAGFPRTAQIEFVQGRLRYATRSRRLELDDAALFRVTSLNTVSRFDMRPSWRLRVGATTVRDGGCPGCLVAAADGGAGFSASGLSGAADLLVTGDVEILGAPGLDGLRGSGVRPGLGPTGFLRLVGGERLALGLEGRWRWHPLAATGSSWLLRAEARAHLTPWLSVALEARRTPLDDEALALLHLFY